MHISRCLSLLLASTLLLSTNAERLVVGTRGYSRERLPRHGRSGVFSIMNANTFLLEVRKVGKVWSSKPDMLTRALELAQWFNTLADEDVPDVVVLNEVFSKEGSLMLQHLCSADYKRIGVQEQTRTCMGACTARKIQKRNIIKCEGGKKFGFSTKVLGGSGQHVKISGGVAILVRAGLLISEFHEEIFQSHRGSDSMSLKGFISVKVSNPDGDCPDVYVLGTHTQAWAENADVRAKQFQQMWNHVAAKRITSANPVVFAGDMNVEEEEVPSMKAILHASNSGFHDTGFWLHLRDSTPWSTYAGGGFNAYLHYDAAESSARSPHDQILYVSEEGYNMPQSMKWQYVPLKSEECFNTELAHGLLIDDLSDHYAAYAELCFVPSQCAERHLVGHRGYTRIAAGEDEKRCCPGRGEFHSPAGAMQCFDWYHPEPAVNSTSIVVSEGCCKKVDEKGKPKQIADGDGAKLCASSLEECHARLATLDLPFGQLKDFKT